MSPVILVLAIPVLLVYFLPCIFALGHKNWMSIFIVNLFFGWTLIGWVFCLAWAFKRD